MIDGIISGKSLLAPKTMLNKRGTQYVIAKMQVYGWRGGADLHGDIIAFDSSVCRDLLACQKGAELSLCGIITPLAEINHGQPETVLRITAKVLLHGYVFQQQRGQGRLFSLMA